MALVVASPLVIPPPAGVDVSDASVDPSPSSLNTVPGTEPRISGIVMPQSRPPWAMMLQVVELFPVPDDATTAIRRSSTTTPAAWSTSRPRSVASSGRV